MFKTFARLGVLLIATFETFAAVASPPVSLVPDWTVTPIAAEPDLVTPTGCCFDAQGRLLVIECHTHFPPDDYGGPKVDRVYRFDDSDGDGVLDRKQLFYEGGVASMNIVHLEADAFAVARRSQVVRLEDTDGDGEADLETVILDHQTGASYPHNGLAGMTLGPDGWLYVGQGENFGEPYVVLGTDGSQQIGGGEGGNIFRCRPDGSNVERIATGFWNPFGLCFDPAKRLWAAGNDPDAMPPNRLMHISHTGDYGFQFRFGRAGIHPLQCWNGELPGTLPMAAGTGEAICSIVAHGKYIYACSWGDNRIERYELSANGASWTSKTEVVVQGDAMFRPVGLAVAPDGSIYVTDWVDRSYPVHGKGRLWRLRPSSDGAAKLESIPLLSEAETLADRLRMPDVAPVDELLSALDSDDEFIRQASVAGLVNGSTLENIDFAELASARQIVGVLTALRWRELNDASSITQIQRDQWLQWSLHREEEDVVLMGLRWATERRCQSLLPIIQSLLLRDEIPPRVFAGAIASIAYIETGSASGSKRDPAIENLLLDFAADANRPANLRALAIQKIPVESNVPSDASLIRWITQTPDPVLAREAIAFIRMRADATAQDSLRQIAANTTLDIETRADALAGLAATDVASAEFIKQFATTDRTDAMTIEARRLAGPAQPQNDASLPDSKDLDRWKNLVLGNGNARAGRRVFYRTQCANCHRHEGRGSLTGPDLSTLSGGGAGAMTPERVLESILLPSKEVGPLYVPWQVLTVDGQIITGLKLDASGVGNQLRFQTADGSIVEVELADVEEQRPVANSIMPSGLERTMSVDELRDLVAFLASEPSRP
jgi:putative membrane-bound dehydrogenase-like protein